MKPTNTTYWKETLNQLQLTEEQNQFTGPEIVAGKIIPNQNRNYQLLTSDENGNLQIHYHDLKTSYPYHFRKKGNKWPTHYIRTRLKEPIVDAQTGNSIRYLSPKESGSFPFFTPGILNKYQNKEEIQTLIITEGEKKAIKGWLAGLDIVGIPSIHGFYSYEKKHALHADIQELIIQCQVKKIIYLTDADTLSINWKAGKELSQRPQSFYSAIKYFRESLETLLEDKNTHLQNVYFSHIKSSYQEKGKGLDDLLINYSKQQEEILEDLFQYQFSSRYFSTFILTDGRLQKVYSYLGLKNEQDFYAAYKKHIGNREFTFKKRRYQYNGEEVVFVKHEDSEKYMRVGADWLKIIHTVNKYGEAEEEIIPYKIGEINRDYKDYPGFIDSIPKFDAFCNVPNWNNSYKRVHNDCYNLCNPLNHIPKEGSFPYITQFLKHLFRGEGNIHHKPQTIECLQEGDQFTVAIDYLSILFQYPKQMLPVLIFVSPEYGTGKSTFLKFLQAIFESNMAILGNEQFKMKFNAHYINKFIISIDEGFLDLDKKAEKERLKQLVTADTAYLENKGMNVKKIPYYGKLIICSNDADKVMKMEGDENRWFVIRTYPIAEDQRDPDLEIKMKEEIPAFIHFLQNRNIFHPRVDRLWFKTDWFITEQFKKVVSETRTRIEKLLEDYMVDLFLTYKLDTLKIPIKYLAESLNRESKYKTDSTDIKQYLKKKGLTPQPIQKSKIPIGFTVGPDGKDYPEILKMTSRPIVFKVEEWLNEEQLNEFKEQAIK